MFTSCISEPKGAGSSQCSACMKYRGLRALALDLADLARVWRRRSGVVFSSERFEKNWSLFASRKP